MPKCPYCEAVVELEDLEFQRKKINRKLSKMVNLRIVTAVLCPACDSILNVELQY
ncbi:MAG: hypothetical protein ACFFDF_19205 [Candidatus Odinarchaeota archaeon]